MNNLEKALAWANLGVAVFPAYPHDTWVRDHFHPAKSPLAPNGLLDATTDQNIICEYWTRNPNALVAYVPGDKFRILDVDQGGDKNKDGFYSLREAGIEIPETFSYRTRNGGSHFLFANKDGLTLGPAQNVVTPDGLKLQDVDLRAGNSYAIFWGDVVPSSLAELAETPGFLLSPQSKSPLSEYSGSVFDWLNTLPTGDPDNVVWAAIDRFPSSEFGHEVMLKKQAELVHHGAEGRSGVLQAIEGLEALWLHGEYDTAKYRQDWNAALAGAVKKYGAAREVAPISTTSEGSRSYKQVETFEEQVERVYRDQKARDEAQRRIISETYIGSEEISWDQLSQLNSVFLVEDLLAAKSLAFLVAKSNIGKTFAYIDMIARMTFGMPWLGKNTRRTKVLIVLGEGQSGFTKRLEAWCEYHGKPVDALKSAVKFIDGANLLADISIARISEVANREAVELIIFDTYAATSGVDNEDSAGLTSLALNRAMSIRPEATSLFVHHPRKSNEDKDDPVMRGSSALNGRADVVMTFFKDKKYKPLHGNTQDWVALSTESDHAGKNRHAQTETIQGLYLHRTASGNALLMHNTSEPISAGEIAVLEFLQDGMSVTEFMKASTMKESTARRALTKAVASGIVFVNKETAANVGATYSRAPKADAPVVPDTNWSALLLASDCKVPD